MNGEILGLMQPGEKFIVSAGPRCADTLTWWEVRSSAQELVGWSAEGDASGYWLMLISLPPTSTPSRTPRPPTALQTTPPSTITVANASTPSSTSDLQKSPTITPETAILTMQPTLVGTPQTNKFQGTAADAEISRVDCLDWATCRTSLSGNLIYNYGEYVTVGASLVPKGTYEIQRIILTFDTRTLPPEAQITGAKLFLHTGEWVNGSRLIHLVKATLIGLPSLGDFDSYEPISGGSASPNSNSWMKLILNAEALAWIKPGALTHLALIHDVDLSDRQPSDFNTTLFYAYENPRADRRPYLEVSYILP
ncbi:MAG: hypothetical protein MUC85_00840 [Anaerolineales bacterium]|nr:hypothetical protein [Anaerolineales bacterium]